MESPVSFHRVRVVAAWDETPTLRGVRLQLGALASAHTRPGQLVELRVPAGHCTFAIASAPGPHGEIDLLVKRGSEVADAVAAAARTGGELETTAPFGAGFPVDSAHGRDVLLFAVGSGVSPIRALVQHMIADRPRFGRVALFYGQRGHEPFAYAREHAAWQEAGVRVVLCASTGNGIYMGPRRREGAPEALSVGGDGPMRARGYVQDAARSLGLLGADPAQAVAFLCGMRAMVEDVRGVLAAAGVAAERTFLNY